jgi:hypothetical protein
MADDGAEVARLRAEVARLARRLEVVAGEVRAVRRRAEAAPVAPHQVVRRAEAAALLDVKPATLAAWARAGRGPVYHLHGNRAWYRVEDLTRWREAAEREAAPGPRQGRPHAAPDDGAPRLPGV